MTSVSWTPTHDLQGWKQANYFKANTTYTGIPYSQTPNQVDETGFTNSMIKSDFYTPYSSSMPMYGNDCSGFVSFAFYIGRHTTWSLESDTSLTHFTDLNLLMSGDAVVTNVPGSEHTFIINSISGDTLYCYEQTPMLARSTTHSKADLVSKGYKGVRNSDWGGVYPYIAKLIN